MDLYRKIGIDPPRGVLLYGPPGKLATPCSSELTAARNWKDHAGQGSRKRNKGFLHSSCRFGVCPEVPRRGMSSSLPLRTILTTKGPRMVRDVFRLARENSPCIIFIDEVDAIATKRFDAQTGSDREVQRILLELLNQMDGFDQQTSVKVRYHVLENGDKLTDRSLWLPIDRTRLTLLSFDLVDWIARLNSQCPLGERGD